MKPYGFEAIADDLGLMPLSARRAADTAGRKPSLAAWRSLALEEKAALCALGAAPAVDVERAATILSRATPPPDAIEPRGDPAADRPPVELLSALGAGHPLEPAVWSGLTPLGRYALAKIARKGPGERLLAAYAELVGVSAQAPHLDAQGAARMVSVSAKVSSVRRAIAESRVTMNAEAFSRLERADAPKGDVLGTARVAGILAAKRTSELIPLCHPLSLTRVELLLELDRPARAVAIQASVEAFDRTGVEMEALTAVSVAALTVYDMLKAFDRGMAIGPSRLSEKTGGRSDYRREASELGSRFAVRESPLSVDEALRLVSRPEAGGVVVFVGTVRDQNLELPVTLLEYEAYSSMALKELSRLGEQLERELPGARLCALHRTGALVVGDVAVVCAASAAHRDLAFRAARLLIDRVKEQVPIWKREHGPSGPYWVGWEDARSPSAQGESSLRALPASASYVIRPARPGDELPLFELVKQLAVYEQLEHAVRGSARALAEHLFGERPSAEALVADTGSGLLGFALFFSSYSTFLTRPGIYLEDLFVLESERRRGIGRALLLEVRRIAEARGAGRLEWSVLDWNEDAIRFYRELGADVLPDWRICRVVFEPNGA